MKNILLILVVFSLLILPLGSISIQGEGKSTVEKHLVINEVCYSTPAKAFWFELYNPTEKAINLSTWEVSFYSVAGFLHFINPTVIEPREYVVVCFNKTELLKYWKVPQNVKILMLDGWGLPWDYFVVFNSANPQEKDIVGQGHPNLIKLPKIAEGHSWARYRGGYDTDNFTNDFYDEPSPTPGYENHRAKYNKENPADVWIYGMGTAAVLVIAIAVIYRFKKRR